MELKAKQYASYSNSVRVGYNVPLFWIERKHLFDTRKDFFLCYKEFTHIHIYTYILKIGKQSGKKKKRKSVCSREAGPAQYSSCRVGQHWY